MTNDFDLAVIGSGFGGSLLAMVARRIGLSVLLLERGVHPRFAIGESTSPLANLILEQLAERYDLPRLTPLTTYGHWRRTYPEVVCGLKRGFTYFKHERHRAYRPAADRSNQLLVAASPCDEVADTHWLRSDVDHFLVNEAAAAGAEYLDRAELQSVEWARGGARLQGLRQGRALQAQARLVVDASGPRGYLSRGMKIAEHEFESYPPTQTLYSHFVGVRRCDEMGDYRVDGAPPYPPYPMDDAALHHVFDGGWMWVLRFSNGVTSAGIAVTEAMANELRLREGEPAWARFLSLFPSIADQFADAVAIREFAWAPRLSYRAAAAAGEGWAMLPSAAAFVDPLFSAGMPLTLLGIERLGRILEDAWEGGTLNRRLREYGAVTLAEADHTARFIAGSYAGFPQFENFTAYSMFYFAAASFSEMARRFGQNELASGFLASGHSAFAEATRALGQALQNGRPDSIAFAREVERQVDRLNIAGLCDPRKRNWYGVDLEDVVAGAAKLGVTTAAAREMLRDAEWAQAGNLDPAIC
jgi:FADH2 O2-dependent halogenase